MTKELIICNIGDLTVHFKENCGYKNNDFANLGDTGISEKGN